MAYRSEIDDPNRRDSTQHSTTQHGTAQHGTTPADRGEGSGNAVWYIAGAVIVAVVLVAFAFGIGGESDPVPTNIEPEIGASTGADADVVVPDTAQTAPATDGAAAPPAEEALPPATEEETVPSADTAN